LVKRDSILISKLDLNRLDGIRVLDSQDDSLSSQSFDEDLHITMKTKNQVESRLFLNIIVRKNAFILELPVSKDKVLLIREDSLLILNLSLDRFDS
jgi:hypothetical protein